MVAERELLEQTLHGAIKALTEVLALANPAAFGRSSRLKELTGALARATASGDAWEIEVASMLVNLGAVTLPDATAEKLHTGAALDAEEVGMAARVPRSPAGFWPTSRVWRACGRSSRHTRGASIRAPARRRADAADRRRLPTLENEGAEAFLALETMRGRAGVYDPELLETFARSVGVRSHSLNVAEVRLAGLEAGMRLVHDARGSDGRLLIARGNVVTPELLERLATSRPDRSTSRYGSSCHEP